MQKGQFLVRGVLSTRYIRFVFGGVLLINFGLTIMSFTNDGAVEPKNKANNESAKEFKSLLPTANTVATDQPVIHLNPKVISFAEKFIRRESHEFTKMKVWGKPYFTLYDKVFAQQDLPKELKYLSVIESHLRKGLTSPAGAVGPWQLMKAEAKRNGLKLTKGVDERRDFLKSTQAASKLLKRLHSTFGDWLLVIAAYNAGEGRVKQAIRKAGSNDFWDLQSYLPAETRNHVKKFIATHYFFEGNGGVTTMTAEETADYNAAFVAAIKQRALSGDEINSTDVINVSGRYRSAVISKNLSIEPIYFNRLNPGLDHSLAEGKVYELRLPKDKLESFRNKRQEILQESVQLLLNAPGISVTAKS
jgi:membrane-bound lytic murein transglycosylase D